MRNVHAESASNPVTPSVPVAIYTRVSTDNQVGGRYDSCEYQAEACRQYIEKQALLGWREIACYTDLAYSGGSMKRPGIRALQTDISAGLIKVVIIYKLERMLRSTYEWCRFSRFLEDRDCRLVSPQEDLSDGSASGRLKTNILMSFAEYERLNVSEKTKAKMHALAQRGIWCGGVVPFGYDYDYQLQKLAPHQTEAPVVKQIYDWAANLMPLNRIGAELNRQGCQTRVRWIRRRNGHRQQIGGKPFRLDTLAMLIRNPIYKGVIRYKDQEYPGRQPLLVSKEKWELANAGLSQPSERYRTRTLLRDGTGNLLKGLLKCADCGRVMLSKASGKVRDGKPRYRYYSCKRSNSSNGKPCRTRDIAAAAMDTAVVGFWQVYGTQDKAHESIEPNPCDARSARQSLVANLSQIETQVGKLNSQATNCVDAVAEDGVSALTNELLCRIGHIDQKKKSLLVERERQRQRLEIMDGTTISHDLRWLAIQELGKRLLLLEDKGRRELLHRSFDSIHVKHLESNTDCANSNYYRVTFGIRLADVMPATQNAAGSPACGAGRMRDFRQAYSIIGEFCFGPKGRVTMHYPFVAELGTRPVTVATAAKRPRRLNPIRRAQAWAEKLEKEPGVSIRGLARSEGISPALVSQHLKLLNLPDSIIRFVQNLDEESAVRVFGYRSLLRLSGYEQTAQVNLFAEMCQRLVFKTV